MYILPIPQTWGLRQTIKVKTRSDQAQVGSDLRWARPLQVTPKKGFFTKMGQSRPLFVYFGYSQTKILQKKL